MFYLIDLFLFNSSVSKEIYEKYLNINGKVLYITHGDIMDKRVIKNYDKKALSLTYLGPTKEYKGFFLLNRVMRQIKEQGYNDIKLNVYGDISIDDSNVCSNIELHGKYLYKDLENIFNQTDVLIVPSIWYETFGFITLEAISHGVPVIVTKNVGSKDIIKSNGFGLIISNNCNEIYNAIKTIYLDRSILENYNYKIVKSNYDYKISSHVEKIINEYKTLQKEY